MLFNKRKKQNRDKLIKNLEEKNVHDLRKKIKILIIDDKQFDIVNLLRNRGYSIFYKNDVTYIEEAEPFDFVIADIVGVGDDFGTYGGFSYAKEIKKIFPHKFVFCYSGTTTNSSINEQIKEIDGFIKKDEDIDMWAEKLDMKIKEYLDVHYHWEIIRKQLKESNLSITDINEIEKYYIESFKYTSTNELKTCLMGKINDANTVLNIIISVLNLSKLFV